MKTNAKRFREVLTLFPSLEPVLKQLNEAGIPYLIGGSSALYVQGSHRTPKDVDILFADDAFDRANVLFNLESQHIERPYNSMNKSTPVDDDSIDFLNHYTSKTATGTYYSPPTEAVEVTSDGISIALVPAEKIAVFKLISRREHHNDLIDFNELFEHPDFNMATFWNIVDSLNARDIVTRLADL